MLDALVFYNMIAHVICSGYFMLVADLFRQAWTSCRGAAASGSLDKGRPAGMKKVPPPKKFPMVCRNPVMPFVLKVSPSS